MPEKEVKPYLSSNVGRVRLKANITSTPSGKPAKRVTADLPDRDEVSERNKVYERDQIYERDEAYTENYEAAREDAFDRSGGTCQFCGLRPAREAHHWTYGKYPSGKQVQGDDLTALCKPCHIYATVLRDWVMRKKANPNRLASDLERTNSFYEKREVLSYWLFPLNDEKSSRTFFGEMSNRERPTNPKARAYKAKPYKARKTTKPSSCLSWIILVPLGYVLFAILTNS